MSLKSRALTLVQVVPPDIAIIDSPLAPSEVRRALKISLVEGMLSQVHISATAGAFLTGFALLLGAGNLTLGFVAALPFLIQPLQLVGAWLIERQGARKPLAVGGSLGRSLWLILVVLPYLPLTPVLRIALLLLTLMLSHALLTLCGNAWTNWMTDLVPPRLRGRYFGTRSTAMAAVAMTVNYGVGVWLDHMRAAGREADGYALIFGTAVLCAAIGTVLLARQPEPRLTGITRLPIGEVLRQPLRHPGFRRFVGGMIVWHVALGVAVPFFSAHALTVLHLPFTTLAMLDVLTSAVSLLTLSLWGQIADRFGQRRVLLVCMTGVVLLPLFWVVATPSTVWLLYCNAIISGIWWPGIGLAQANRLMEQSPAKARGAYLALFAASTGLAYFLASMMGGLIANALAEIHLSIGGYAISNYKLIFIMSSVLRGSAVLFWRKSF